MFWGWFSVVRLCVMSFVIFWVWGIVVGFVVLCRVCLVWMRFCGGFWIFVLFVCESCSIFWVLGLLRGIR